jgi:hypothetical protein
VTPDQMNTFIDRWRDIERKQKDIDYLRAVWVRDVRAECGSDKAFASWCERDLGLSFGQCADLLSRVAVLDVIPDAADWRKHGGWRGVRPLATMATKRERVAVLESAKAQGLAVLTVVRQRRYAQAAARPDIAPKRTPTSGEDAARLARFVLSRIDAGTIPDDVREIIERWAPGSRKVA